MCLLLLNKMNQCLPILKYSTPFVIVMFYYETFRQKAKPISLMFAKQNGL